MWLSQKPGRSRIVMKVQLGAQMCPWGSCETPPSLHLGASSLHSLWESSHELKQSKLFPEKNCGRCRELGTFNLPSKNWDPKDSSHLKLPHPPEGSSLGGKANYLFMSFRLSTTLRSMLILAVGTWEKKRESCDSLVILSQVFWIGSGQENGQGGG